MDIQHLVYNSKYDIMKKIIYSLLIVSSMAFAQETKNVGDFNKVTSFDRIDVLLISGDENKVILNGKDSDEVEIVNKNGELKIRIPLLKLLDGDNISVTVYYKNLTAIEANEGSRIACNESIKTTSFDIIAKEGSEVKLILDLEILNARVANGSKLELQGSAKNQIVILNSGGIFEASGFETQHTEITVKAGGRALIFANEVVDAKVRAGGSISISGNPKQINKDIIAGGTICIVKQAK